LEALCAACSARGPNSSRWFIVNDTQQQHGCVPPDRRKASAALACVPQACMEGTKAQEEKGRTPSTKNTIVDQKLLTQSAIWCIQWCIQQLYSYPDPVIVGQLSELMRQLRYAKRY
jgi:hypothetical protein